MKNKAILIYHQYYDFSQKVVSVGGVQTYITELSKIFQELNYDVKIVQASESEFAIDLYGVEIFGVKISKFESRFLSIVKRKLCQKASNESLKRGDIVIFGSDHFATVMPTVDTICIQHGIDWDLPRDHLGRLSRKLFLFSVFKKLSKSLGAIINTRKSDLTVCVDYNFPNWLRTVTIDRDIKKYKVIPNFTNVYTDKCNDLYNVSTKKNLEVVFARRLFDYRGVSLMAEAVAQLLESTSEINFTFAGTGPELNKLKSRFCNTKRVRFTTYNSNDSLQFHSKFDVAVVPSLGSEGTSLSLLEGMAAGCAVIATNVGGLTNIVLNGYNGLLITPTVTELKDSILKLSNDSEFRHLLSERGVECVKSSFSKERWKTQWINLIEDINK